MTDMPDPVSPRPAPSLTTRERAALKARAHALEPVVRVGHAGVTDAMVAEIDRALEAHELIKVKIGEGDRDARVAHAEAISVRTGAAVVQRVGRVLILWRPRPELMPDA
jgi:putative YhbY family RNA-binding protein